MTVALSALAAIALAALVVRAVRGASRAKDRKLRAAFAGREPLGPDAFYERYFLDLGIAPEVASGVRQILEERLDADLSCLRAEDDFSQNLSFFWDFDSMADVEIVRAIEAHFRIEIADSEAQRAHTVADLVRLVSGKVARSN